MLSMFMNNFVGGEPLTLFTPKRNPPMHWTYSFAGAYMEVFDIRGIGSKNHNEKHGKSVNLKLDTLEISIDKLFSIRDSLSQPSFLVSSP